MVSYHFYTQQYLGDKIPEQAFPGLAARASRVLERLESTYTVTGGQDSRAMAICAMAECLHVDNRYSSASVGSVSIHYPDLRESLSRRLYQAAGTYLDIYRGVG